MCPRDSREAEQKVGAGGRAAGQGDDTCLPVPGGDGGALLGDALSLPGVPNGWRIYYTAYRNLRLVLSESGRENFCPAAR